MADEPSNGELARRLEAVHQDIKDDFRELAKRLDAKVSLERYELERRARDDVHTQMIARIAAIEEARAQEQRQTQERRQEEERQAEAERRKREDQRRADRRLVFTALIAPVLIVLLTVYLQARGAGG